MGEYVVRAEVGAFPVWTVGGDNVVPDSLPLSQRVLTAMQDWTSFFDDVGGAISDPEVLDEFVSQGFKIAHAMRRELKGATVHLDHPVTAERTEIVLRAPK
ncbi:MAG: hypothetical protein HKN94_17005 [Acidimicrobiales bacterium]|nr:hypothetical protein [Acidimicrobiales bacterium]RZV48844.1 MAG: hypothetical protein EX269_00105 [Acidimicrobiales bacterium]